MQRDVDFWCRLRHTFPDAKTNRDMATALGVPEETTRRWSRGARPSLDVFFELAARIGVSPLWLYDGTGNQGRDQCLKSGDSPSSSSTVNCAS